MVDAVCLARLVARFISDGPEAETVLWERSVVEHRYEAVMEVVRDGLPVTGIIQRFTKVRSPTKTGKIERFHKTIQTELLTGRVFDDLAQAQAAVDTWAAGYNTRRPHQALAMQAPAERFTQPQAAQQTPGGRGRRWRAAIGPVPHGHRLGRAAAHRAGRHRAVPRLLRRGAAQDRAPHHPQRRRPLRPHSTTPTATRSRQASSEP
jgi:hypothetical protein